MDPRSLYDIIRRQAPERAAIVAVDRPPVGYGALLDQIERTGVALRRLGIARGDRVALVVRNGPDAAIAFLGIASFAVCAPLNPALQERELGFCLADLRAVAVVLEAGAPSPARAAARRLGIRVLELDDGSRLLGEAIGEPRTPDGPSGPDDCALVLHTSGTTARPKKVALTHRNICVAAARTAEVLELTPDDRSLNVLPLFHVHGLVGAMLAPLVAGGSVVCSPGFVAAQFFPWMAATRPTWFTAVPTIHQAILARARLEPAPPVRFVRSASSPLPTPVLHELERVFRAPVIETYGMTEASPIIACNPQPPRARKVSSVGMPVGAEVAILDEADRRVAPGKVGEIIIRGDNVITAYEDAAADHAFVDGWLRTGDLGYLDEDGYLFVTGRRKEIINRGGEKIAPFEVEDVLLRHPAVAQAVVFGVADAILGEAVAAAVVTRPGMAVSADELLAFAAPSLAEYKLPQHTVFATELPRNASGKVVRRDLAAHLDLGVRVGGPASAATSTERAVRSLVAEVLRVPEAIASGNFFELGGDSSAAGLMRVRIEEAFGVALPLQAFYAAPTSAELAARIDDARATGAAATASKIPIVPRGDAMPTSPHQDRWLQVHLKYPRFSGMNVSWARIAGVIDAERLLASVHAVIARHEIFHVAFAYDGTRFTQSVVRGLPLEIPYVDVRAAGTDAAVARELQHAFDFHRAPLWRISLLRTRDDEHFLLLNIHHALCDYASKRLFCLEVARHYTAVTPVGLPIQYLDFASWHHRRLATADLHAEAEFWRTALSGDPTVSLFGAGRKPGAAASPVVPVYASVDRETVARLRSRAAAERVSVFAIIQLAFLLTWRGRVASDDFLYNTMATTSRDRGELLHLIGTFAGSIAIRFQLHPGQSVWSNLQRLHGVNLASIEHELPVTVLRTVVGPAVVDKNRTRVAFNYFQTRTEPADPKHLDVHLEFRRPYQLLPEPAGDGELVIYLMETASGELVFNFSRRLADFDGESFAALVSQFLSELERIAVAAPD